MSNFLSNACVKVGGIRGYKVYARSRNNSAGLKYVVTHGEKVLYSCANNGAEGSLAIHWRYRGHGPEPILPSEVIEYVEQLVAAEDNQAIDHYNAILATRGIPEHTWARKLPEMVAV